MYLLYRCYDHVIDFTEEDFAMLERTAHVRFGPTTVLAPSSSSKSGTQNSQRSSTGFSGSSSSSGSQARPPLRVVDQNAWKGSQPANAPPSALKSAIATSTLPQNRSTSTSSTMQSAGAVSNSRSRASTTPNKVYSQSNQMSQKATQSMSQVAKSQTVPPTTKHVIPAVAAAKSIPMSQTLPPNVKSTSVSSSTKTTAPTPVTAVIEVLSADELAMWDQLEMQATKAIAHATIVPATTTIISTTTTTPKYSAPLNSVLSDARAPILCYKYSVLAVEHHIQGKDRMQRLYCCDLVSSSTRSSSLTIEPPNPTGIVDLWDDWKESALAVGDEILIISLSAADVRAATKYVAGLAPVNVPSANFVDFSDSLPTPPFINNPSGLRRHRIDRDQGLLVTRPRVLISPTRVAEACSCARRCVVSERVRSVFSSSSAAGVLGNLKHDFIEVCLFYMISSHLSILFLHASI